MMLRNRRSAESGFTVVEVMMAVLVLLVGVLGTVTLIDNANRTTGATKAREAGNNLARDLIEASRNIPYASFTPSSAATFLQQQAGLADSDAGTPGWQVERRGVVFTVDTTVCFVDDARDGRGTTDSSFCQASTPTTPPDATPADYKRAFFDITYNVGSGTSRVRQSAVIADDDGGPRLNSIVLSNPSSPITSGTSATFTIDAGTTASSVEISVDGTDVGKATKTGPSTWSYTWDLGTACAKGSQIDGTFLVSAQAYDAAGALGGSEAVTIAINRCAPLAVDGLDGTRFRSSPLWAEMGWNPNDERDVVGYRVWRDNQLFQCAGQTAPGEPLLTTPQCLDTNAPSSGNLDYDIRAYDRDPSGNLRAGPAVNYKPTRDNPPYAPTNLTATSVATGTQLTWTLPPVDDPDGADQVIYFRIYRDGTGYANRVGTTDDGLATSWIDTNTGGTTHTYRVVAVDNHYGESSFAGPVTR